MNNIDIRAYIISNLKDDNIEEIKTLNPYQQEAVLDESPACLVNANVGSGTEKLPRWVRQYTGRDSRFVFTSGGEFPENLSPYALIIHCGACMLGEREMQSRLRRAAEQCIPVTNYGIAIAQIHGILDRALRPFSALHAEWEKQQQ